MVGELVERSGANSPLKLDTVIERNGMKRKCAGTGWFGELDRER